MKEQLQLIETIVVTDLTTSQEMSELRQIALYFQSSNALWQFLILSSPSPSAPMPYWYQPSPSFSQFSPQPPTLSSSDHTNFPATCCLQQILTWILDKKICGCKFLSGGTESEAEWIKCSLAMLVKQKLQKMSWRTREIFQQQKDELQWIEGLRKD